MSQIRHVKRAALVAATNLPYLLTFFYFEFNFDEAISTLTLLVGCRKGIWPVKNFSGGMLACLSV